MNGSIIGSVENYNFLGLVLSSNLKWSYHIDHISRKISRARGVINALKLTFPLNILLFLYDTLILRQSIIVFLLGVLRFVIQRKKQLIPLFKKLNFLKIDDIYKLKVLKLYYNLKHDSLHSQFFSMVSNLSIASYVELMGWGILHFWYPLLNMNMPKQVFGINLSIFLMGRQHI